MSTYIPSPKKKKKKKKPNLVFSWREILQIKKIILGHHVLHSVDFYNLNKKKRRSGAGRGGCERKEKVKKEQKKEKLTFKKAREDENEKRKKNCTCFEQLCNLLYRKFGFLLEKKNRVGWESVTGIDFTLPLRKLQGFPVMK